MPKIGDLVNTCGAPLPCHLLAETYHPIADRLQGDLHHLAVNLRRETEIDREDRANLLGKRNRRGLRIRRAVHDEEICVTLMPPCAHGDIAV